MGVNSYYTYITIKEVIFIHAYVTGEEIPSSQALQILGQFNSEEISGTIRETRRYRIRKNGEELFQFTIDRNIRNYLRNKDYTRMKS
jgi:hypothetical protein